MLLKFFLQVGRNYLNEVLRHDLFQVCRRVWVVEDGAADGLGQVSHDQLLSAA